MLQRALQAVVKQLCPCAKSPLPEKGKGGSELPKPSSWTKQPLPPLWLTADLPAPCSCKKAPDVHLPNCGFIRRALDISNLCAGGLWAREERPPSDGLRRTLPGTLEPRDGRPINNKMKEGVVESRGAVITGTLGNQPSKIEIFLSRAIDFPSASADLFFAP